MDLEEELENALNAEWRAWDEYHAAKRAAGYKRGTTWVKKALGVAHAASGKVAWLRSQVTR
jgi:hypothetical protein